MEVELRPPTPSRHPGGRILRRLNRFGGGELWLFRGRELSRLQHIIQLAGLPGILPSLDTTSLLEAVKHDKKISGGKLRFVLPIRLGQVVIRDIEPALVAEVLTAE